MSKFCKPPRSLRSMMLILLLLILIGAAINFPIAIACIKSRTKSPRVPFVMNLRDAEASVFDWPTSTPHEIPWPSIDSWSVAKSFGYTKIDARASGETVEGKREGYTTMEFHLMGWPFPALERVQMWWDWDHPNWQTTKESDPAMRVHWVGAIGNPIFYGVGCWLLLFASVDAWRWFIRRRRAKGTRCLDCGYDLRAAEGSKCPECGVMNVNLMASVESVS